MSQQGERAGAADWWSQLYDKGEPDTGGSSAGDSLDDRYDSAAHTLGAPGLRRQRAPKPGPAAEQEAEPAVLAVDFVGDRPPTYEAEPTALPVADHDRLDELTPDTVLDGARYGPLTLRAASMRGDSARYRGEPRRDALLTARFGSGESALLLVAVASGPRAAEAGHRAARNVCHWIGGAVGRSYLRLAEDIRASRRGALKSGLSRLTARSLGKLRAEAAELGLDPAEYTAELRCMLLPADPRCRIRVFFGAGGGGLFRLRGGEWQDIEPRGRHLGTDGAPVLGHGAAPLADRDPHRTVDLGIAAPGAPARTAGPEPSAPAAGPPFRFRSSVAQAGDTLVLCSAGVAEPLRAESAFADRLAERWTGAEPPGLAGFLADVQLRVKGYADDRTVAAVWEA
ncbi:protein phosphatase 2C domain-containing protein [Streptomyces gobiensis]|uniref:protein phosphatase 2C domain-containing protein n=1 Tax=Streptomyces gobiensis TaxID=2875706 RepID=UPI001E619159|nr:protein phosphatase 2C domain-containing protein [Streptomyces gobiensis]UGY94259.1 protein phosphatase 2C domain-containing protein [Streptomyces gobiensis]